MPRSLQLNHHLKGNLPNIYAAVLDMCVFGKHHPYMKEVKLVQSTYEFTQYNIKEFVWIFGFIPQWPNYNAKVFEVEKNKHIRYTSAVKGGVNLVIDFYFSHNALKNATKITENVELKGSILIGTILMRTINKAHIALFKNMEQVLLNNSLSQNKN